MTWIIVSVPTGDFSFIYTNKKTFRKVEFGFRPHRGLFFYLCITITSLILPQVVSVPTGDFSFIYKPVNKASIQAFKMVSVPTGDFSFIYIRGAFL